MHIVNDEPLLTWYSPFEISLFWEIKIQNHNRFLLLISQNNEISKGEYQVNKGSSLTICEPLAFDIPLLFQKVLRFAVWSGEIQIPFG